MIQTGSQVFPDYGDRTWLLYLEVLKGGGETWSEREDTRGKERELRDKGTIPVFSTTEVSFRIQKNSLISGGSERSAGHQGVVTEEVMDDRILVLRIRKPLLTL